MLKKVKDFFKYDIVRVFSLNGLATFIKILTGFVGIKVISVLIGPDGIGLLGQFNNFSAIFLALSTAGITTGVTKYVAEYSGSREEIKPLLQTSVYITIFSSLICGLLLAVGAVFFSDLILESDDHAGSFPSIFIIFGLTIVLYAFNVLLLSILNGFGEFKKYVVINIVSSVVGFLFLIVFAYFFGVYGALLSVVTFQPVVFIVNLWITVRASWFSLDFFRGRFYKREALRLGRFSLMALASAVAAPAGQLLLRTYLAEKNSLGEAGLWEAMNRMSAMYLMVIETSLILYYLPKLSRIDSDADLRNEIISAYKFIIPPLLCALLLLFLLRGFIINVLFDPRFLGMENLFAFQLIGDFFKVCGWLLAYQMLAKSMTKTFISTEILFSLTFVFLGVILIPLHGAVGATVAYAVNCFLYFAAVLMIFRRILLR